MEQILPQLDRLTSERGSILIHVLVTAILCSVIAVGLLSFLMLQYKFADVAAKTNKNKKFDELAMARVMAYWDHIAGYSPCAGASPPPYSCTAGASASCNNACTAAGETCSWACYCTAAGYPTVCVGNPDGANFNVRKVKFLSP